MHNLTTLSSERGKNILEEERKPLGNFPRLFWMWGRHKGQYVKWEPPKAAPHMPLSLYMLSPLSQRGINFPNETEWGTHFFCSSRPLSKNISDKPSSYVDTFCVVLVASYIAMAFVCNTFPFFRENPRFVVLGQKEKLRRSCFYGCTGMIREWKKRNAHVFRKFSTRQQGN